MPLVVDASAIVAAVADSGERGRWAREALRGERLVAPALLHFEVANALRGQWKRNALTENEADAAHSDFLRMRVAALPFRFTAPRAWELRENCTMLDASYIAAAELLETALLTLDMRLTRAPGSKCRFLVYRLAP